MIIRYILYMWYREMSEMSPLYSQWSHLLMIVVTVDCDDRIVWSVDHIVIVIYINGVCYRGSSEMSQIHVQWSHFWRVLVTVYF